MLSEAEFFIQLEKELKTQGVSFIKVYKDGKCVGYKGIRIVESIDGLVIYRRSSYECKQINN